MKNLTLILSLFCLSSFTLFSQNFNALSKEYLKTNGEVIFTFTVDQKGDLTQITKELAIVNYDASTRIVKAMATNAQFETFLKKEIPFEVAEADNIVGPRKMTNGYTNRMSTFPLSAYPTYADYVAMMNDFANGNPSICKLENIGTTTEGDKSLLFVKLSDNAAVDEQEPRVMLTSSMHGDEIAGFPMMLNLIDYLLDAYVDTNHPKHLEIKNLLDNNEVWINPLANPDGTYRNSPSNTSVANAIRGNANNVDLNRNYPDPDDGAHTDGNVYQAETQAFMALADSKHFVLSANFHGGIELANYPWDTYAGAHPDESYFIQLCEEYRDLCQANSPNGYFDGRNNGITNGFAWYEVQGGRQDYMIYYKKGREITVELSDAKTPPASQLVNYWDYNRDALIAFMNQVNYGIRGVVSDANTDQPIDAKITVLGRENYESWVPTELPRGDFYRTIEPGTYDLLIEADCYLSQTITGINVTSGAPEVQNVQLVAVNDSAPSGLSTTDIADTSAVLNWDTVTGATFEIQYRALGDSNWNLLSSTTNSIIVSNLSEASTYEARVRSVCSGTIFSNYSSIISFNTLDAQACTGINTFPYSESYEIGFGEWTNASGDDIEWTRDSGGTPSNGTGPSSGQDGSFYLYTEASTNVSPPGSPNKVAILNSPCIDLNNVSGASFDFAYHMNGTAMGSLEVLVSTDEGLTFTSLWAQSGSQGNTWITHNIILNAYAGNVIQLQIKGTTGSGWSSDIAIDAFQIESIIPDTEAPTSPTSLSASNITAVAADLTWNASTDNVGILNYEIYQDGTSIGTSTNTTYSVSGLNPETNYSFTVKANDTSANTSSASNSVSVITTATPACSGINAFPYTESFESTLGQWINASNDDIEWTRDSAGTPSNGTGPSTGQDGSFYLYTEASTNVSPPGSPNKIAILNSPCIDLSSATNTEFSFGYHMNGTAMGSLEFLVSTDTGTNYTSIWSINGSQGNAWNTASIDLSSYIGSVIQVQFKAVTGTGWSSDIAIDNLQIISTTPDTESPSSITDLTASNITTNSSLLNWTASNDNVAVTSYDVFQNSVFLGSTSNTNYQVSGLMEATTYSFNVIAKDAAGNSSSQSNTLNVTTLAPDTQAPTAPSNLTASNISETTVDLNWNAATDNVGVTGYSILQNGTQVGTTTNLSISISGLTPNTTYLFTVQASDGAGNNSVTSNEVSVTTLEQSLTYCTSQGNNVTYEYIDYVGIGGISNTTGANGGYADFTNIVGSITRGSNSIDLSVGFAGAAYNEFWNVWIDFNQNGIFETSENIVAASTSSAAINTYNFDVPSTAFLGNTRMRVSMQYNGAAGACASFTYGEVEDYTINIAGSTRNFPVSNTGVGRVTETENLALNIYPNPVTNGVLFINSDQDDEFEYHIINSLGQLVKNGNTSNHSIDISKLSSGSYFVSISYREKQVRKQFIVKH